MNTTQNAYSVFIIDSQGLMGPYANIYTEVIRHYAIFLVKTFFKC